MTKPKDTIERAYTNVPKEIPDPFSWEDSIPWSRPVRYFWVKWIVRKIFR